MEAPLWGAAKGELREGDKFAKIRLARKEPSGDASSPRSGRQQSSRGETSAGGSGRMIIMIIKITATIMMIVGGAPSWTGEALEQCAKWRKRAQQSGQCRASAEATSGFHWLTAHTETHAQTDTHTHTETPLCRLGVIVSSSFVVVVVVVGGGPLAAVFLALGVDLWSARLSFKEPPANERWPLAFGCWLLAAGHTRGAAWHTSEAQT